MELSISSPSFKNIKLNNDMELKVLSNSQIKNNHEKRALN
jgi:hypothetical protein